MLVNIDPFKVCLEDRGLFFAATFVSSTDAVIVVASFWLTQKERNDFPKQECGRMYKEDGPLIPQAQLGHH